MHGLAVFLLVVYAVGHLFALLDCFDRRPKH
jgi:hypothetical protein